MASALVSLKSAVKGHIDNQCFHKTNIPFLILETAGV